jgi:hypothetical protein
MGLCGAYARATHAAPKSPTEATADHCRSPSPEATFALFGSPSCDLESKLTSLEKPHGLGIDRASVYPLLRLIDPRQLLFGFRAAPRRHNRIQGAISPDCGTLTAPDETSAHYIRLLCPLLGAVEQWSDRAAKGSHSEPESHDVSSHPAARSPDPPRSRLSALALACRFRVCSLLSAAPKLCAISPTVRSPRLSTRRAASALYSAVDDLPAGCALTRGQLS